MINNILSTITKPLFIILSFRRKIISHKNAFINKLILLKNNINAKNITIKGILFISNDGIIELGNNIIIRSGPKENNIGDGFISRLITKMGGALRIGDNVGISNSTIFCTNSIRIGDNVLIGNNTKIWDTDFHSLDQDVRRGADDQAQSKPIEIRDNVFIGANTIILKGVTIGEGSVIGAGSVLSRNVPAGEIWAGNPAQFIKSINDHNSTGNR